MKVIHTSIAKSIIKIHPNTMNLLFSKSTPVCPSPSLPLYLAPPRLLRPPPSSSLRSCGPNQRALRSRLWVFHGAQGTDQNQLTHTMEPQPPFSANQKPYSSCNRRAEPGDKAQLPVFKKAAANFINRSCIKFNGKSIQGQGPYHSEFP